MLAALGGLDGGGVVVDDDRIIGGGRRRSVDVGRERGDDGRWKAAGENGESGRFGPAGACERCESGLRDGDGRRRRDRLGDGR